MLKVLIAARLSSDLLQIAARGARYGFPGWVSEAEQPSGKIKVAYLDALDAERRARTYSPAPGARAKSPAAASR